MRPSSDPAPASSRPCRAVASESAVSVLVIDCTTMGAPPPMMTSPTRTWRVVRRRISLFGMLFQCEPRNLDLDVGHQIDRRVFVGDADVCGVADDNGERRRAFDHLLRTRRI